MSNVCAKNVHGCTDLCAVAPSCWYHRRDNSRKETSSSIKSANSPDKISVHDSDVKGPSKYIGPFKVLFHIPHHTFTDQRTWWRFSRIRCYSRTLHRLLNKDSGQHFAMSGIHRDTERIVKLRRVGFYDHGKGALTQGWHLQG
ncbi:uncharacterized protein TNCV_2426791 [Trichonephila clavipes]|nr:uncharacterized protein TNCV_2426791 [Trichonephila clavipes]